MGVPQTHNNILIIMFLVQQKPVRSVSMPNWQPLQEFVATQFFLQSVKHTVTLKYTHPAQEQNQMSTVHPDLDTPQPSQTVTNYMPQSTCTSHDQKLIHKRDIPSVLPSQIWTQPTASRGWGCPVMWTEHHRCYHHQHHHHHPLLHQASWEL